MDDSAGHFDLQASEGTERGHKGGLAGGGGWGKPGKVESNWRRVTKRKVNQLAREKRVKKECGWTDN